MATPFPRFAVAGLAGLIALGGCSGYGYGGVSVGTGYYGASSYYDPGYGGYYGWYDGFYYPGSGYYVFDRQGHRHRWRDNDRRHWEGRRAQRGDNHRDDRRDQ
ncbi:MAG: peptidase, partial [Alphaproteobacteria bacterium]|nr:peptidase [Alphaproteobacteria bacterium]